MGSAIQIDHRVSCWVVRWELQQLFGPQRLEEEELDDVGALWLYEKAKKLHNSDLNARAMSEVSHRMLPLALLQLALDWNRGRCATSGSSRCRSCSAKGAGWLKCASSPCTSTRTSM